jgi:DNA-binding CsgD family transcriptional regulator
VLQTTLHGIAAEAYGVPISAGLFSLLHDLASVGSEEAHGEELEAAGPAMMQRLTDMRLDGVRRKGVSRREIECLLCLAAGMRSDEIAQRLSISTDTVEFHFRNVRRKLGARTREQALAVAIAAGLMSY